MFFLRIAGPLAGLSLLLLLSLVQLLLLLRVLLQESLRFLTVLLLELLVPGRLRLLFGQPCMLLILLLLNPLSFQFLLRMELLLLLKMLPLESRVCDARGRGFGRRRNVARMDCAGSRA
jgi:hypothetical protein